MKFILIKRYRSDEEPVEIDDLEAEGFDAAIRTALTDCIDDDVAGNEDSDFVGAQLVHVAAIVDMAPHIERELTERRKTEESAKLAAQEAAERAEYERLRAKFEPKKEHVAPLTATATVSAAAWAPSMANPPSWPSWYVKP